MNYHKVLTRNDAGKHSHQSGFHVSKIDARSGFFPALDESLRNNPRCDLNLLDRESGEIFKAKFIFYNKSKNEYRVTGISSLFKRHGLDVGDEVYLEKKGNILIFYYKRTSSVVDNSSYVEKPKAVRRRRIQLPAVRTPSGLCDDLDLLLNPQKIGKQGYSTSSADRKAVEIRAMFLAREWLQGEGFTHISDCSSGSCFDFSAFRDSTVWKVEVKGTTQPSADTILMTSNEVSLHRTERGSTIIVIVHGIRLDRSGTAPRATGGAVWAEIGWDVDKWTRTPTAFRVQRIGSH